MSATAASTRFDGIAQNYATSEVHRSSPSIQRAHEILNPKPEVTVCDIACGAGHFALSFADVAGRLAGVDPSPRMLDAFRSLAEARGLKVETFPGTSEDIPLADGAFDLVVSRLAPHHFPDLGASLREMKRVLRPDGRLAIIDLQGHPDPEIDEFNHQLEVLHDPTHERSHTVETWIRRLDEAGLEIEAVEPGFEERPGGVTLERWCEIAASGDAAEREIRALISAAPDRLLRELNIRRDGEEIRMPVLTVLLVGRARR